MTKYQDKLIVEREGESDDDDDNDILDTLVLRQARIFGVNPSALNL